MSLAVIWRGSPLTELLPGGYRCVTPGGGSITWANTRCKRPDAPGHFGYNGGMSSLNLAPDLPRTADLAVIGGGIAGLATAFFAARAGIRAVVLEKRPALCSLT